MRKPIYKRMVILFVLFICTTQFSLLVQFKLHSCIVLLYDKVKITALVKRKFFILINVCNSVHPYILMQFIPSIFWGGILNQQNTYVCSYVLTYVHIRMCVSPCIFGQAKEFPRN